METEKILCFFPQNWDRYDFPPGKSKECSAVGLLSINNCYSTPENTWYDELLSFKTFCTKIICATLFAVVQQMSKSLMCRTLQWGLLKSSALQSSLSTWFVKIKGRCRVICIKVKNMVTFQTIIVKKKTMLSLIWMNL